MPAKVVFWHPRTQIYTCALAYTDMCTSANVKKNPKRLLGWELSSVMQPAVTHREVDGAQDSHPKPSRTVHPSHSLLLMMEEVGHLSLPRTGSTPVVEEGTDDFGSDRVELQVRDVVEVLLAVFQDMQERKSKKTVTSAIGHRQ